MQCGIHPLHQCGRPACAAYETTGVQAILVAPDHEAFLAGMEMVARVLDLQDR
jgi:hypothetical protein